MSNIKPKFLENETCLATECSRPVTCKGRCRAHYSRYRFLKHAEHIKETQRLAPVLLVVLLTAPSWQ